MATRVKRVTKLQASQRESVLTPVILLTLQLLRLIQRPPEIPRRDRAVRPPSFAEFRELLRRGKLSFAKSLGETFANSVVVHRPDVGPAKIEQEKHLDRPAADAAHRGEARDDFVIAHPDKYAPGWHGTVDCFRCEILQCCGLGARKASRAKSFIRRRENLIRIEPFSFGIERANATEDCRGGFTAELLISNRFGKRVKWTDGPRRLDIVTERSRNQG